MELHLSLSEELIKELKVNNNLKTKNVVNFILESVEYAKTNKAIDKTALKDIDFNGKQIVAGMIDEENRLMILFLTDRL